LAQEGAHVVAADLDTHLAEETAALVTALGRTSLALQVDVARRPDIAHKIPIGLGDVQDFLNAQHASIIHEDINAPQGLDATLDHPLNVSPA